MRRLLSAVLVAGALALVAPSAALAAPQAVPYCAVVSAQLDWGFKESFRAYIDGSIANGEWTVADGAEYETPTFSFTTDEGGFDAWSPRGSVAFPGSVRFTGHGGILDTTIANPVLEFRGDGSAVLLLDVSGPTMEGDQVAVTAAEFVEVDLTGQHLEPVDGVIELDAAPTTLTAAGAEAFPNYEAGTAFDPVSARIDIGDCPNLRAPGPDSGIEPGVIGNATPFVILVLSLAGALVLIGVVLFVSRLRRR